MKKIFTCIMCLVLCLSLAGCSLMYVHENNAIGNFSVGYSEILHDAFLSDYDWDGTEEGTKIVVPEEYNGVPITQFGGATGRGVPCSFSISPSKSAIDKYGFKSDVLYDLWEIRTIEIGELKTVHFDVHISKNIKRIVEHKLGGFWGCEYLVGETKRFDVFVFLCTVTCDEDNETFYARNGKLYFRADDTLVPGVLYYDFDLDAYMAEKMD